MLAVGFGTGRLDWEDTVWSKFYNISPDVTARHSAGPSYERSPLTQTSTDHWTIQKTPFLTRDEQHARQRTSGECCNWSEILLRRAGKSRRRITLFTQGLTGLRLAEWGFSQRGGNEGEVIHTTEKIICIIQVQASICDFKVCDGSYFF